MEAATEISWKKRCSYKQLFWKLPRDIFSQNPWKISLKKFVFSKVALSCSWKFLAKKETGKKHNFHKFLYEVNTSGSWLKGADCQPATLLKMNFFVRIFQGFFKVLCTPLFWSYKFYLSNVQAQSLLYFILKPLQCIWFCFFKHKGNFMPTQQRNFELKILSFCVILCLLQIQKQSFISRK